MPNLVRIAMVLMALGVVLWAIEALFPSVPGYRRLRPGFHSDLGYFLLNPLVTKTVSKAAVIATVVLLALLAGAHLDKNSLRAFYEHRHSVFGAWPRPAQAFVMLFCSDFVAYWAHRAFHRGWLWKIHAVHHSSRQLDWLAAVRVHPLNDILTRMAQVIPFFFLGFRAELLAGFVPFITLYAIFLHANVSWGFGPLRWCIATPLFHRWHHTSQLEGRDKNFAGFFPFWDWLFGTLYLPAGEVPREFGVFPDDVPEGFWAQLLHPFRRNP